MDWSGSASTWGRYFRGWAALCPPHVWGQRSLEWPVSHSVMPVPRGPPSADTVGGSRVSHKNVTVPGPLDAWSRAALGQPCCHAISLRTVAFLVVSSSGVALTLFLSLGWAEAPLVSPSTCESPLADPSSSGWRSGMGEPGLPSGGQPAGPYPGSRSMRGLRQEESFCVRGKTPRPSGLGLGLRRPRG